MTKKGNYQDLTGQTFYHLTAIRFDHSSKSGNSVWLWKCNFQECGKEHLANASKVKCGQIKSCGCYHKYSVAERSRTHGHTIKEDGIKSRPCGTASKEYECWINMRRRCGNTKDPNYHRYGGRGISVCERWQNSFEDFLEDVGMAPTKKHSLGRIDNDKDYCKSNVQWETPIQQCNNKSTNHLIEMNGRRMTVTQWARELDIPTDTMFKRVEAGWSNEKLITPLHHR